MSVRRSSSETALRSKSSAGSLKHRASRAQLDNDDVFDSPTPQRFNSNSSGAHLSGGDRLFSMNARQLTIITLCTIVAALAALSAAMLKPEIMDSARDYSMKLVPSKYQSMLQPSAGTLRPVHREEPSQPAGPAPTLHYSSLFAHGQASGFQLSEEVQELAKEVVLTVKSEAAVVYENLPMMILQQKHGLIQNRMYFAEVEIEIDGTVIHNALEHYPHEHFAPADAAIYTAIHRKEVEGEPLKTSESLMLQERSVDRYKFLPLHGLAYRTYPDAKFSFHIESDTYVIEEALLRWLVSMNPEDQLYGGFSWFFGERGWAAGGSGYLLSKGLLDVTWGKDHYLEKRFEHLPKNECCGDLVLSDVFRALHNKGVTATAPNVHIDQRIQRYPPTTMQFSKENLCSPIITFGGVTPQIRNQLFEFEKLMYKEMGSDDWIRYIDVFDYFLPHYLQETSHLDDLTRNDWDIQIDGGQVQPEDGKTYDADFCRQKCEAWEFCLTWSFVIENGEKPECRNSNKVRVGLPHEGSTSGWRLKRIMEMRDAQPCAVDFRAAM